MQLFAEFRRITGTERFELDLPPGATVRDVLSAAHGKFPALREFQRSTLVARGLEFAKPEEGVGDGDEISLMPPVAGG